MGNFGSSVGLKTAEKISQNTFAAIEKLKISESTQNLTETLDKLVHPPGPIDFRIQLDISPNVIHLVETFFVLLSACLLVGFILIIVCWGMATATRNGDSRYDQNGKASTSKV